MGGSDANHVSQLVPDLSVKKTGGQLLGRRYRWDFQVSGGKGDTRKVRGFPAMHWRKKNATVL